MKLIKVECSPDPGPIALTMSLYTHPVASTKCYYSWKQINCAELHDC